MPASWSAAWRYGWRDVAIAVLAAAIALASYLALGQGVLHGDAGEFLWRAHTGAVDHVNHLGYVPLLSAVGWLAPYAGLTMFEAARACSAAGVAAGVALAYAAARRLGLPSPRAGLVALLVATMPSVLYFATVVEVHGPYFALLGLAWLAAAHLGRTMRPAAGAWLGAACGLAYCMHASAMILPLPMLLVAWQAAPAPWRARGILGAAAVCLTVHAGVLVVVPWLLQALGFQANPTASVTRLVQWSEGLAHPGRAWSVLWHEWLWPYAPVSLLWLRAWAGTRAAAGAVTAALLPYLAVSFALLPFRREFGAYQHAVAWLFAWLVVRTWSPRVVLLAAAAALATALGAVLGHDDRARVRECRAGLQAAAGGERPLLLAAGDADLEVFFVMPSGFDFEYLASPDYGCADRVTASLARLDALLASHAAARGRVFLSNGALEWLGLAAGLREYPGFARLCSHLLERWDHREVAARGFTGWELTAR